MIQPALQDEAFLADVAAARDEAPDAVHLWWLGQSGFLVQHRGRHLLFDPYLSDSLTRKYAGSEKPHVRMTRRVVAPEMLGFVDVMTSTHNHTDHLDPETIVPIVRAAAAGGGGVELVLPAANVEFARNRLSNGLPAVLPIDVGGRLNAGGFIVTAVPAAHDQLATDAQGRHVYLGYVVRVGPLTIYHSGDTILYDGMTELLLPFRVDVAIFPINGKLQNMNGVDAAKLASEIGARWVVPCHYDMFEFNTASPQAEFVPSCERLVSRIKSFGPASDGPYLPRRQGSRHGRENLAHRGDRLRPHAHGRPARHGAEAPARPDRRFQRRSARACHGGHRTRGTES